MKLIIDIDDDMYAEMKKRGLTGWRTCKEVECMDKAIYSGTPLPKGHGAIIDVKDIEKINIVNNGELTLYKLGTDVEAYIYATPLVKPDEENKQ